MCDSKADGVGEGNLKLYLEMTADIYTLPARIIPCIEVKNTVLSPNFWTGA